MRFVIPHVLQGLLKYDQGDAEIHLISMNITRDRLAVILSLFWKKKVKQFHNERYNGQDLPVNNQVQHDNNSNRNIQSYMYKLYKAKFYLSIQLKTKQKISQWLMATSFRPIL